MKVRFAVGLVALASGLAAAAVVAPRARAWDVNNLPAAFHVTHTTDSSAATCGEWYSILYAPDGTGVGKTGAASGRLCTDSPTFQQDVDAFVVAPCSAPGATCTAVATTAPTTTDATTTTAAAPPADTTTTGVVVTVTTSVTTTVTDPTVEARLTAIEQRQAVDEARIAALEAKNGIILGEPKNVAPFTAPV
jgi:hypothetical protein